VAAFEACRGGRELAGRVRSLLEQPETAVIMPDQASDQNRPPWARGPCCRTGEFFRGRACAAKPVAVFCYPGRDDVQIIHSGAV
jgi:hypothetical protein